MGMKEMNRDKLIEGLQKLPSHKAPDAIWKNIERSLKQDPALQEAIKALPSYKAPEAVWNGIQQEIAKPAKVVRFSFRQFAAAACLIGIVLFSGIKLIKNDSQMDGMDISISEEIVDDQILDRQVDSNDADIEEILALCENMEFICSRPQVSKLKSDLLELSEAKSALVEALGEYGTEIYLIEQLSDIEMQQISIAKELLNYLI